MSVLFTQYWDVIPGKYDEYSDFVSGVFNPALGELGIRLLGGYYVAVGQGPRIVAVALVKNGWNLMTSLADRRYRVVLNGLLGLVHNYSSKVWAPTGHVHDENYTINPGAWKFNQYYTVIPGKEAEHHRFVKEECLDGMKELALPVTGGWRLVIGSGPLVLAECTAKSIEDVAKAINTSNFRRLVRRLKKDYVLDYSSRILAPTGRIEVPFFMGEMMKGF